MHVLKYRDARGIKISWGSALWVILANQVTRGKGVRGTNLQNMLRECAYRH